MGEFRRVPYNLIVGVIGAISLLLFFLFISLAHKLKPGYQDAVEPMALLVGTYRSRRIFATLVAG